MVLQHRIRVPCLVLDGTSGIAVAGGEPNEATSEFYDPDSGAWSPLPDMPVSLKYAGGAGWGGELFVAGGEGDDGAYSGAVYALRSDGRWEDVGPIPGPAGEDGVVWHAVTLADKDDIGC